MGEGDAMFVFEEGAFEGGSMDVVNKPKIIDVLLPAAKSECGILRHGEEVCSSKKKVAEVAKSIGMVAGNDPVKIIEAAKAKTGCETEKCAIVELGVKPEAAAFKINGPTDGTWLNNYKIDAIMQQYKLIDFSTAKKQAAAILPAKLAPTKFFAYNFNMRNYAKYSFVNGEVRASPDTLATISFKEDLYDKGYNCAGCIINSDTYQGTGKHWMALFLDWRLPDKWSVEFFNSSGNPPALEWCNWMQKMKTQMELAGGKNVSIVNVSRIQHQQSRSECGLYSLFYVYARLVGFSYEEFLRHPIHDKYMFEFRMHIFNDKFSEKHGDFDWEKYQREAKVEWE